MKNKFKHGDLIEIKNTQIHAYGIVKELIGGEPYIQWLNFPIGNPHMRSIEDSSQVILVASGKNNAGKSGI